MCPDLRPLAKSLRKLVLRNTGIEPSERFTAALEELGAAANEMLQSVDGDEVEGFAMGGAVRPPGTSLLDYDWIAKADGARSLYVYLPEFSKRG